MDDRLYIVHVPAPLHHFNDFCERGMKISPMQVTLIDSMGSDLSVVNAARVSFDKESVPHPSGSLYEKDEKLISYLARHKHTSPFNHCFATFRVKAPIFVARQLVKHKFMPWNEVSRRYVDSEPEFYFPEHWRKKAENVKQGSSEEALPETVGGIDEHGVYEWSPASSAALSVAIALRLYNDLIKEGCCAEQARMVLPQNTMTEWVWSGTLGAFADMCRLRLDSHSQKETREIAEMISNEMQKLYPVSWKALLEEVK
jgi:thymidylate synthase (FAD)